MKLVSPVRICAFPAWLSRKQRWIMLPSRSASVVQAVSRETARIVALPEVRDKLESTGHTVNTSTPEQFTEKVKLEVEKFRKIILASKMQQD